MNTNMSYLRSNSPQYVQGLLKCPEKKTATSIANALNVSHDQVYRNFNKTISNKTGTKNTLQNMVQERMTKGKRYLILDDTQVTKMYAKHIEGLDINYDNSLKKPYMGLKFVNAMVTNGKLSIPIDTKEHITKRIAQSSYQTKSSTGIEIIQETYQELRIDRILADGHFSTNEMLSFLVCQLYNFLMKINRSRKVVIGGQKGQLQHIFRLKGNSRVAIKKGTMNGYTFYFYAIKVKSGSTMYLISNDYLDPYTVTKLYRIRWQIEIFHRTAKQLLGLSDCQMLSIEKQRQHVLHVMHAYAIASIQKIETNLSTIEDAIRLHRIVKSIPPTSSKQPSTQKFHCYA